jgi:hypothetical protein
MSEQLSPEDQQRLDQFLERKHIRQRQIFEPGYYVPVDTKGLVW